MSIKEQFERLAQSAGGSFKTVSDRVKIADRLAAHLKASNIQVRDIRVLKSRHIKNYIQKRQEDGISKRTMQNEMSAIRAMLRQADRAEFADDERLSNKALGIDNASRDGTHRAMPDDKYQEVFNKLGSIDAGVQACAALERWLGLRGEEAVQANKSLNTWAQQLAQGETVRVIYGTKGGRSRDVRVPDIERAREAVSNALALARTQAADWSIGQTCRAHRNATATPCVLLELLVNIALIRCAMLLRVIQSSDMSLKDSAIKMHWQ